MARFFVLAILLAPLNLFAGNTSLTLAVPAEISTLHSVIEYTQFLSDALKDANIDLVPREYPQKRFRELLEKGLVDSVIYDDQLPSAGPTAKFVSVSFPIAHSAATIFYPASRADFKMNKLARYHGGFTQGNLLIEEEVRSRSLNADPLSNAAQGFRMILAKRLDYFITLRSTGESLLERDPIANSQIKFIEKAFVIIPIYFTLHKSHKDKLPRLEAAFRKHLQGNLSKYPLIQSSLNKNVK